MAENGQEGPLGNGEWAVNPARLGGAVHVFLADADGLDSVEVDCWFPQQLRDFARALERAADALEGKE